MTMRYLLNVANGDGFMNVVCTYCLLIIGYNFILFLVLEYLGIIFYIDKSEIFLFWDMICINLAPSLNYLLHRIGKTKIWQAGYHESETCRWRNQLDRKSSKGFGCKGFGSCKLLHVYCCCNFMHFVVVHLVHFCYSLHAFLFLHISCIFVVVRLMNFCFCNISCIFVVVQFMHFYCCISYELFFVSHLVNFYCCILCIFGFMTSHVFCCCTAYAFLWL